MPDPIRPPASSPTPDIETLIRQATGVREDASIVRPPPGAPSSERALIDIGEHAGIEAVFHATAKVAPRLAPVVGMASTPVSLLCAGGVFVREWLGAHEEGDRRNQVYHRDVMRGALAVFEGRLDSPEVARESKRSPGYADGVRRATRLYSAEPEKFVHLCTVVRRASHEGQLAVVQDRDRDSQALERYASDPAFQHGVDYMRRMRDRDPEAFRERALELSRATDLVQQSRSVKVRP